MSRLCSCHHLPRRKGRRPSTISPKWHCTDPFHSHVCQCIGIRAFWKPSTSKQKNSTKYSSLGQALEKNSYSFFMCISTIFFSPSLEECHFPYYQSKSHGWSCREKLYVPSSPCSSPALSQAPRFAQSWYKFLFEQKQAIKQHVLHWPTLCSLFQLPR